MSRIMPFERAVYRYIRESGGLSRGGKLLVACSGGPDSMALLYALVTIAPKWDLTLGIAVVNHQLRPEAMEEVAYVQAQAATLGLPCYVHSEEVATRAKQEKKSVELMGREVRYAFFDHIMDTEGYDGVAVAHHKDDQAETVLAHLLRGCGPNGLAGMAFQAGRVYRPLLGVRKQDILAYLTEKDVAYCTDASNLDTTYQRNRIRWDVLPQLAAINPQIVDALDQLSTQVQRETAYWDTIMTDAWQHLDVRETEAGLVIDRQRWQALHVAMQARLWQRIYKQYVDPDGAFTGDHIRQLLTMTQSGERKEFSLGQMKVIAQYGKIEISFK